MCGGATAGGSVSRTYPGAVDALSALLPPAGLLVLFVLLMRSILHADRRERAAAARSRRELDAELGVAAAAEKTQRGPEGDGSSRGVSESF